MSRVSYPDSTANALQTLHTASSLAGPDWRVDLFVHDSREDSASLGARFGVDLSNLRLRSLGMRRWPSPLRRARRPAALYNSLVALNLAALKFVGSGSAVCRVLFVRSRLEILYWGLMRSRLPWLRGWLFVCEVHELWGLEVDATEERLQRQLRAVRQFDLVIAVTRGLAADLSRVAGPDLPVEVLPLCSGLARAPEPSRGRPASECLRVGYVGSLDEPHGVADLVRAFARLPRHWTLCLVGRERNGYGQSIDALARTCGIFDRIERKAAIPYSEVGGIIESLDICLSPAGATLHSQRYRSPLKIFDYMACGKPIVAADVPAHRELLDEGEHARFYPRGAPEALAKTLLELSADPSEQARIARGAWERSARHTYAYRAEKLRDLFKLYASEAPAKT